MIIDRRGRLERDEATGRWRLAFAPADDRAALPPMEVLPGPFLAEMESIVTQMNPRPVTFHVTAEITRYRGRAYVMIRKALAEHEPIDAPTAP